MHRSLLAKWILIQKSGALDNLLAEGPSVLYISRVRALVKVVPNDDLSGMTASDSPVTWTEN